MNQRFVDVEDDDPMLSMVNIVDIFLVIIVILFIIIMENPLNPFSRDAVTVIKNPGKENMEIVIKQGQKLEHYKSTSEAGSGQGTKAGVTYRLDDGSLVYVPESGSAE
ncbi:MAG: DUF2149 domain-containing protein [Halioglobus sp.]|nr:DUF2149 domain-containing protein [Halioglobus sp.]